MAQIVLTTISTRYTHTAYGLRCLYANLGLLQPAAEIREFLLNEHPAEIAEKLLQNAPRIIGVGVYIWNIEAVTKVIAILRTVAPHTIIVLGGPEVSYEVEDTALFALADYIVQGEGELVFAELCRDILAAAPPQTKLIRAAPPDLSSLAMPYRFYPKSDIDGRTIYVEASRGCLFSCEFCLSSLDSRVRQFPLPALLNEIDRLLERGARIFKFVDRTFNLQTAAAVTILQFFIDRLRPGLFLHFEVVPDRLPEEIRRRLRQFPAGVVQLEVGIQSFNDEVNLRVQRRQSARKAGETLRFLRAETRCYLHADLIVGLPGETLPQFAAGFDSLLALQPHEIQVGILKRLKGTKLSRRSDDFSLRFNPLPPYEVLATSTIDYPTMQRLKRFARYFDLVVNSGNLAATAPLLWFQAPSPFFAFLEFSDWLYKELARTSSIALKVLTSSTARFLLLERKIQADHLLEALRQDCRQTNSCDYASLQEELRRLTESPAHIQPQPLKGDHPKSTNITKRQNRLTSRPPLREVL